MKRDESLHVCSRSDLTAGSSRQVPGSQALFGIRLTEWRFTKERVGTLGQALKADSVPGGIGKIGRVDQSGTGPHDQNFICNLSGSLSRSIGQDDRCIAFSRCDAQFKVAQPGTSSQSQRGHTLPAHVQV